MLFEQCFLNNVFWTMLFEQCFLNNAFWTMLSEQCFLNSAVWTVLSEQRFSGRSILQLTIEYLMFSKDTFIQTSLFKDAKSICRLVLKKLWGGELEKETTHGCRTSYKVVAITDCLLLHTGNTPEGNEINN
jgi:hypothetical protein